MVDDASTLEVKLCYPFSCTFNKESPPWTRWERREEKMIRLYRLAVSKHSSLRSVDLTMTESVTEEMLDGLLLDDKVTWPSTLEVACVGSHSCYYVGSHSHWSKEVLYDYDYDDDDNDDDDDIDDGDDDDNDDDDGDGDGDDANPPML
eukprot:scaffold2104_cov177-Ochromonas_danica.AAC.1